VLGDKQTGERCAWRGEQSDMAVKGPHNGADREGNGQSDERDDR